MMMEGLDLILLESNLHQYQPVIISQIINMIESDNFCHHKTFESVKSNLWNMWSEGIQELENVRMHCTDDDENNNEMDKIEVIDLCSVSQCGNDRISEGKESAMQESQDKSKHDETNKKVAELKTVRDESTTKKYNVESAMMCWESTESLAEKEHREEPEKMVNKLVKTTEKEKHEEEHVKPTLNTGNRLKISIEDKIEVIDLCSVSQCGNDRISEGKESAMQESQDKSKHDETNKKVAELKTVRDESTTKKYNVESAMMCWESTESLAEKEHREEPEKMVNKLVKTTEKEKHEEEHVKPTLNTGNRLKISIEEFSWEREGDGSTLGTEEPEQQEVVYITNLEDGF